MPRFWPFLLPPLALAAFLLAACQPGEEPEAPAEEAAMETETSPEEAIRERISDFEAAWGDAQAIADLFSADGDVAPPDGVLSQGREGVAQRYAELFAGPFKGTEISITADSIRMIGPDVAISTGSYQITGMETAGEQAMPSEGTFMTVSVKEGDEWLIAALRAMVPVKTPGTT